MSIVDQIRLSYPQPIAKQYEAMYLEVEPRQRVYRLVELFEVITRYLALVGLASYIYFELKDPKVEEARKELERPSLGSWTKSLLFLDFRLRTDNKAALLANTNQIHKDDPLAEAYHVLCQILGMQEQKKVKLVKFMEALVQFRNTKIGHGQLHIQEANIVLGPLEAAMNQWLAETTFLHQHLLIFIARIAWEGEHFIYYGTSLNSGTSLSPFKQDLADPSTPDQVYLYHEDGKLFVPLYPLMIYDKHSYLLYLYSKLSNKRELLLECPYNAPLAENSLKLNYDESIVTGVRLSDGQDSNSNDHEGLSVSKLDKIHEQIKSKLTEEWLTDSQAEVWAQLNKLLEPPYYVVNIYGVTGAGKTFLAWLLEKQERAVYELAASPDWSAWKGQKLVVLDGYDPSRRKVRTLRTKLQLTGVAQAIILTRQKAQDDIPCLHLEVTDRDVQIAKANLYRHLDIRVPEENLRNLWDCFTHLEEQT